MIAAMLAIGCAAGVNAQSGPSAEEIRASTERERNAGLLRSAVRRLARRPTDSDAMIDAGNASLALGDAKAALNFFTRADGLRPNNGRIKLGLATANVRSENPFEALRLFDEAVKLGISQRAIAADRALAFDLLGNFALAQRDYALARTADSSDKLLIRHAISLSLSGDTNTADGMLVPLLQRNVGEAWRARAFILAARGNYRESLKVTQGFMDARSARNFAPYLRRMPELTGAQQAAAIHLGHFPARNIGRDSAAVRNVASRIPVSTAPTGAGRLIPSGKPLGRNVAIANPKPAGTPHSGGVRNNVAIQPPSNVAAKRTNISPASRGSKGSFLNDVARVRILAAEKAAASLSLVPSPPIFAAPASIPQTTVVAAPSSGRLILPRMPVSRQPSSLPAGRTATPSVIFKPAVKEKPKVIARAKPPVASPVQPAPLKAAVKTSSVSSPNDFPVSPKIPDPAPPAKPREFDLGAVVGSIKIPESEQKATVTPVDLNAIKPTAATKPQARLAKVKATKKSAEPQYPARNWVQIATGGKSRFKGDMRNYAQKYPKLFKGLAGWSSPWSKSHRLVVGPFDSLKAARQWEARFRKAGGDGFVWQSPKGRAVKKLK